MVIKVPGNFNKNNNYYDLFIHLFIFLFIYFIYFIFFLFNLMRYSTHFN